MYRPMICIRKTKSTSEDSLLGMSGRDHPGRALIGAIGGLISKAGVSHDKGDINKTTGTKQRAGIIVKTFRSLAPLNWKVYELRGY